MGESKQQGVHHDTESYNQDEMTRMKPKNPLETLLWCMAIPGFGQLLNGKYFKGLILILLEFAINLGAKLNVVIMASFHGEIDQAISQTNYNWLMFYPCVYMYAMWDAYRDAGGGEAPYSSVPFQLAAYLGTVGVIYSDTLTILGVKLGPVWLPIITAFVGMGFGIWFMRFLRKNTGSRLSE